jgi:transcriptional regulator with XRE-family HTH domain
MDFSAVESLAVRIQEKRGGMGIREAAKQVGVSPATLSRVENKKIPDLETFEKICQWLGDDPSLYLGIAASAKTIPCAQVHFKKGSAIEFDSAKALADMILLTHQALREEDDAI